MLRVAHLGFRPVDVVFASAGGTAAFLTGSEGGLDAMVARVASTAIAGHLLHLAMRVAIRLQRVGLRVGIRVDFRATFLRVTHPIIGPPNVVFASSHGFALFFARRQARLDAVPTTVAPATVSRCPMCLAVIATAHLEVIRLGIRTRITDFGAVVFWITHFGAGPPNVEIAAL